MPIVVYFTNPVEDFVKYDLEVLKFMKKQKVLCSPL